MNLWPVVLFAVGIYLVLVMFKQSRDGYFGAVTPGASCMELCDMSNPEIMRLCDLDPIDPRCMNVKNCLDNCRAQEAKQNFSSCSTCG